VTHLVFLPETDRPRLFAWGGSAPGPWLTAATARSERATVVGAGCAYERVSGVAVPLADALPGLAALGVEDLERVPASVAVWSLASKLALDLVARGRMVPKVDESGARWAVSLTDPDDAERVSRLARAFPAAAHAVPVEKPSSRGRSRAGRPRRAAASVRVWHPQALLKTYLDAAATGLVRAIAATRERGTRGRRPWERRWREALTSPDGAFSAKGFAERTLIEDLEAWTRPLADFEPDALRTCLRLEPTGAPTAASSRRRGADEAFRLEILVHPGADPSLLVPAGQLFTRQGNAIAGLGVDLRSAEERLLRTLALAGEVFPPLQRALEGAVPQPVELGVDEAGTFLTSAADALMQIGIAVMLPAELTRSGRRRLRLRMKFGDAPRARGSAAPGAGTLRLGDVLDFQWEVDLAGHRVSAHELDELAAQKRSLVRFRGQWVVIDPLELAEAGRLLAEGGGALPMARALAAALAGDAEGATVSLPTEVTAGTTLATVLERIRTGPEPAAVPGDFAGTLRPYQVRGLAWLVQLTSLGLGALLADDMGLGKTIELLAFLLDRRQRAPHDDRPSLLVCPTSVIGNWQREAARFAPTLPVVVHHGADRADAAERGSRLPAHALVITSYGLLRRDIAQLAGRDWATVALDEAQNIKNPASRTAQAARSLRAAQRIALTGTPVENRLTELWSISEFLNPGLLGSREAFRREIATPIERYGHDEVAARLGRIIQPFLLRRVKTDPQVITDLPPRQEASVVCALTREQVSLYQAALDETMTHIEGSEGIERRGLVLALITALKQICNHPAQYLGETRAEPRRSGKLQRLVEMLEEAVAEGDRALVFTQYREMGDRLVATLERELGREVVFLHGGVERARRDRLVKRFQEDADGPRVFVVSLKAGGTGLNLTAASHVFHFDRWWNPAVEDQATDRAWRIGQTRVVQVHKLVTAGTVEEKIEAMLAAKRDLARRVVSGGERWITELGDRELRELFSLTTAASVVIEDEDLAA
jgi:superfamily II DNA or RNA helicase